MKSAWWITERFVVVFPCTIASAAIVDDVVVAAANVVKMVVFSLFVVFVVAAHIDSANSWKMSYCMCMCIFLCIFFSPLVLFALFVYNKLLFEFHQCRVQPCKYANIDLATPKKRECIIACIVGQFKWAHFAFIGMSFRQHIHGIVCVFRIRQIKKMK